MLQRFQTVYLFLAFLCMVLTMFFTIAIIQTPLDDIQIDAYGVTANGTGGSQGTSINGFPFFIPMFILAVIPAGAILFYKQRKKQLAMGRLCYFLYLGYIVFSYMYIEQQASLEDEILWRAGFYLPVASITFIFLANRAIKQDEELVRSVDRLR